MNTQYLRRIALPLACLLLTSTGLHSQALAPLRPESAGALTMEESKLLSTDALPGWLKKEQPAPTSPTIVRSLSDHAYQRAADAWSWENILAAFSPELDSQPQLAPKQSPAEYVFETSRAGELSHHPVDPSLSGIAPTGGYSHALDSTTTHSSSMSTDLLRPATPRQGFSELSTSTASTFRAGDTYTAPAPVTPAFTFTPASAAVPAYLSHAAGTAYAPPIYHPAAPMPVPSSTVNAPSATITLTVTTLADNFSSPTAGSLRAAINTANADPNNNYVINFSVPGGGTMNLAANASGARMLPVLTNPMGISINGANGGLGAITIDGGSTSSATGDRVFFVGVAPNTPASGGGTLPSTASTAFSISNFTIANGNARGGNASGGAGGGAGLGGAIFVNAGNLSLGAVSFSGNRAVGGNGGNGSSMSGGGGMGGGGMGGNGNRGGGGFGIGANGGGVASGGSPGSFQGGASGGGGAPGSGNYPGGINGGGGGGNFNSAATAGGGGVGGSTPQGGFGGGGGASSGAAGNGGFGGGAGMGFEPVSTGGNTFVVTGRSGGFGGGGSGAFAFQDQDFGEDYTAVGGAGGFGAGSGGSSPPTTTETDTGGGGGLGAGGAVFVRQGASVTLVDGALQSGTTAGGVGGTATNGGQAGGNGQGIGSGMFLAGSATYSVSNNNTVTISDTIGGGSDSQITGGFTKSGPGTLGLSGANTYTGGTTVSAGKLLVNNTAGSGTGSGAVTVNSGGTLGGTGSIAGAVTVNNSGTLAPGNSPGRITLGNNLNLNTGATLAIELGGLTAGTGYDQVLVAGALTLTSPNLVLSLVNGFNPTLADIGAKFYIVDLTGMGTVSGTFANATGPMNTMITDNAGNSYLINYADSDPNDPGLTLGNDISLTLVAVPETSTWVAAALAMFVLIGNRRFKKRFAHR